MSKFKLSKAEARKLWVAALRSGKYRQAKGRLHTTCGGNKYCCLGVACEVFLQYEDPANLVVEMGTHASDKGTRSYRRKSYNGQTALLPEVVRKWLGLRTDGGDFKRESDCYKTDQSLIVLNDSGTSFAGIAEIIESAPQGLFRKS